MNNGTKLQLCHFGIHCKFGDRCKFSHSIEERDQHRSRVKYIPCKLLPNCPNGSKCWYSHDTCPDISYKSDLIEYKFNTFRYKADFVEGCKEMSKKIIELKKINKSLHRKLMSVSI